MRIWLTNTALASFASEFSALRSSDEPAIAREAVKISSSTRSSSTVKLVSELVNSWRGRSVESAFADYAHSLAARRNRVIALVRVASPMTSSQIERLTATLNKQVGQPVRINIEIDTHVLGGVSVRFADELVDGTVSNRLAGAARAVVGSGVEGARIR